MRFWFVHSGEVSLREQLITQVQLGIASGDLRAGERLPSTRAMAQRYGVHANTVSAAYRELESLGHVEMRHGSGVYIRSGTVLVQPATRIERLDAMLRAFHASAQSAGFSRAEIADGLARSASVAPVTRFLLVEPDPALRNMLLAELAGADITDVDACGFDDLPPSLDQVIALALPSKVAHLTSLLPVSARIQTLQVNSVPQSLLAQGNIPADALVGIASAWGEFLRIAETMLIAAGVSPDCLVKRNVSEENWQSGLAETAAVVCDVVTAKDLPAQARAVVFRVVAPASIDDVRRLMAG